MNHVDGRTGIRLFRVDAVGPHDGAAHSIHPHCQDSSAAVAVAGCVDAAAGGVAGPRSHSGN